MRRILILALFLTLGPALRAQRLDPQEYIYPIRGVSGLCSANFGEIRAGHFHSGVDIKTEGVEGKPLVAVADGYVSHVVVSAGGYGRAVYLTLRNGKTAVYGHLQRFRDDLERHVRAERYRRERNGVDLSFAAGQWPVSQGDVVGYSGNSGSSMGPHLHFELRDTRTQKRYNLVREGVIRPADNLPPRIVRLHYVEVDTLRGVPVRSAPESYAVERQAAGRYRLTRAEPVPAGRKGYFVVEVTDRRNGVHNTFGVWRVRATADGVPYFEYRMDGFTYDEARSCDAVSCYALQLGSRNECIRLAQLAGAPDTFYPLMTDRGLIRTGPGEECRIAVEVEDDSGNRSRLEFTVRGRAGAFRAGADAAGRAVTGTDAADTDGSAGLPGAGGSAVMPDSADAAATAQAGNPEAGNKKQETPTKAQADTSTKAQGAAAETAAGARRITADTAANPQEATADTAGSSAFRNLPDAPGTVVLRHDRAGSVRLGRELTAYIPAGALYEPLFCRPERLGVPRPDSGLVVLSPAYRLFDARTPLHRAVTVSIRAAVPASLQLRTVAAVRTAKGGLVCAGGSYADGALTVATRTTGELTVVADTLPPAVRPRFKEGADLSRARALRFTAKDNFSGIAAWTLRIDGRWVPCDRYPVRGALEHAFDAAPEGRRHRAELSVTDGCGNTTRWTGTFYR